MGSFIGSFELLKDGTLSIDTDYLSIFADDSKGYYLQKAESDMVFTLSVDKSSLNDAFILSDSKGQSLNPVIKKLINNRLSILPPKGGYIPGERYTLLLNQGASFTNKSINKARKLVFSIDKEDIEAYEFQSSVVDVQTPIIELSDTAIKISNSDISEGDVILSKNDSDEYVAYKVKEVVNDDVFNVETPTLDEIFSSLEVYGEYTWDVNDLAYNKDLKIEIENNIRASEFYKKLLVTAYADEGLRDGQINVDIKPNLKDNSLEISIELVLLPGQRGLFDISSLKNQSVSLNMSVDVGMKANCNIQGFTNWDVSTTLNSKFEWSVDIGIYNDKIKGEEALEGLFSKDYDYENIIDYHKKVKKISNALNKVVADTTGGEIKLFDWKIPTSVPGVFISAEVKLYAQFKITADVSIGQTIRNVATIGICMQDEKFSVYSNTSKYDSGVTLSIRGKASCKAGIKLLVKVTFVRDEVANIYVDPQVGLYADGFATLPLIGSENISYDILDYLYFESGVYLSANFGTSINLLLKKVDYKTELIEKKFPFEKSTFGNSKIPHGIHSNTDTIRAINNAVSIPDIVFEYYDVKKGIDNTKILPQKDLRFLTKDGIQLTVNRGEFEIPSGINTKNMYVTASYTLNDVNTYYTLFKVLISGSTLEGKVSAYDDSVDGQVKELEGAEIILYEAGATNSVLLSSTTTDSNGSFSFNVSEGDYQLEISADGYQPLVSTQHVEEDEIKYTEHMMLIDDSQLGLGSASGSVLNALNGRGVSNATLRIRENWNNQIGDYAEGFVTRTDASGKYNITNVPTGYYTIEASRPGYVTGYSNLIVLSENPKLDNDFTITPIIPENEIRIVLTWGRNPLDIDSHLIGRTPSNNSFNVYYEKKVYQYQGVQMANLDVDDTSSYGPETVTILQNIHGRYVYLVHDFTNKANDNSSKLSLSNAIVKVYKGSIQVAEYHVPADQIGNYWTVFEINSDEEIIPINRISNFKPQP